jgi:hypothetical protein
MNSMNLAIMVKNEEATIIKTLSSCKNYINKIFMYDTGSTDSTIKLVKDFCDKNSITLYLLEGEFESYCISRNKLLDFIEPYLLKNEFILLLDANDELYIGSNIDLSKISLISKIIMGNSYWNIGRSVVSHLKMLFIRNACGIRYEGDIHEYLKMNKEVIPEHNILYINKNEAHIYQNRIHDEHKTIERAKSDLILLKKNIKNNIYIGRNYYLIGRTYFNMNNNNKAQKYFEKGINLKDDIGKDELYQCHYYLSIIKKSDNNFEWINHIYEALEVLPDKIEGILLLCDHFIKLDKWNSLYIYARIAIKLSKKFNDNENIYLLYNDTDYKLYSWYYYAIACFNLQKYKKALNSINIIEQNLKKYGIDIVIAFKKYATLYHQLYNTVFPLIRYAKCNELNNINKIHSDSIVLKSDQVISNEFINYLYKKYNNEYNIIVFKSNHENNNNNNNNNIYYLDPNLYDIFLQFNIVKILCVFDNVDYIRYCDNINKVIMFIEQDKLSGSILKLHTKLKYIICKSSIHKEHLLKEYSDLNKIKYKLKIASEHNMDNIMDSLF